MNILHLVPVDVKRVERDLCVQMLKCILLYLVAMEHFRTKQNPSCVKSARLDILVLILESLQQSALMDIIALGEQPHVSYVLLVIGIIAMSCIV